MASSNRQPHESVRLLLSLSIIFGAFTLGFYVAIQGPTLMDLIDILHVNQDIMSHSLAMASLAYSLGGLLSGIIFEYVDRQMLIPAYYLIFGLANILTPYITNYYVFSVITVFKMMCAGGTDCGANVWILDMWPGKDAWLQALHFSFAVGCALGPLVVEPFLSAGEHKDPEGGLNFKDGHAIINENTESRIYIPYGVSGSMSVLAAVFIVWLFFIERKRKREDEQKLQLKQQQAAANGGGGANSELIPLTVVVHQPNAAAEEPDQTVVAAGPAAKDSRLVSSARGGVSDGCEQSNRLGATLSAVHVPDETINEEEMPLNIGALKAQAGASQCADGGGGAEGKGGGGTASCGANQIEPHSLADDSLHSTGVDANAAATAIAIVGDLPVKPMKFSSKAKEHSEGRPPYYVMFAITITAMCLSFYCGIEITSMNYLATFAVNIDLQLPKSTAALMSSALTISFAVGRLLGIWIAAYMRPHKLFYLCAAVMATGNVLILVFANTTELFLWASICLFGIGCGPMYASIVSFYDDKIAKVTNTVSGIFILGSMFNVALNTVIIGHYIIDNALILIVCNLMCAALLLCIFGSLHLLTKVKMHQRKRKFLVQQTKKQQQQESQSQSRLLSQSGPAAVAVDASQVQAQAPVAHLDQEQDHAKQQEQLEQHRQQLKKEV